MHEKCGTWILIKGALNEGVEIRQQRKCKNFASNIETELESSVDQQSVEVRIYTATTDGHNKSSKLSHSACFYRLQLPCGFDVRYAITAVSSHKQNDEKREWCERLQAPYVVFWDFLFGFFLLLSYLFWNAYSLLCIDVIIYCPRSSSKKIGRKKKWRFSRRADGIVEGDTMQQQIVL